MASWKSLRLLLLIPTIPFTSCARVRGVHQNCLLCNVQRAEVNFKQGYLAPDSDFYLCETDAAQDPSGKSNQLYLFESGFLQSNFVNKHRGGLATGLSQICIPQGRANRTSYKIERDSVATASPKYLGERTATAYTPTGRLLSTSTGTHSVLVVLVSSTAGESDPNLNPTMLQGNVFGIGPLANPYNLATQYGECSHYAISVVPGTGNTVKHGVMELQYNGSIAGGRILGALQNSLLDATKASLGINDIRDAADHVMFCLPNGALIGGTSAWASFGFTNGVTTWFQSGQCQKLSSMMHEIGHNLGYYHSGLGTDEYGDRSGYMGNIYSQISHPLECFNAHKNWISGWFDDRKISLNVTVDSGAWGGKLTSFVDYIITAYTPVLINVGDLYIQLNSAKRFNNETKATRNQIAIVQANSSAVVSERMAGLVAGQSFTYPDYGADGLVIEVCGIVQDFVDMAQLSIYLNNTDQRSLCGTF